VRGAGNKGVPSAGIAVDGVGDALALFDGEGTTGGGRMPPPPPPPPPLGAGVGVVWVGGDGRTEGVGDEVGV